MARVNMSTRLTVPADEVWKLIGRFSALPEWHPAIETSATEGEGEGAVRRLQLVGGGTIEERLERIDDDERLYTYTIVSGPLPVANYKATVRVRDDGEGGATVVEWSSEFEPAGAAESDAVKTIQGVYQAGFDNLKRIFGM